MPATTMTTVSDTEQAAVELHAERPRWGLGSLFSLVAGAPVFTVGDAKVRGSWRKAATLAVAVAPGTVPVTARYDKRSLFGPTPARCDVEVGAGERVVVTYRPSAWYRSPGSLVVTERGAVGK
jgi:hypothetical protein